MKTHGESRTKFYYKYRSIWRRCNSKTNKDYKRYGGRGIKLKWTYEEFKKDMYKSYLIHCKKYNKNNTSLDRIDNNGNYCKENCKWSTNKEQSKNKRNNRYITFNGRTMIIADWAKLLKISRQSIRYRLEQNWDIESIIKTPFNHNNIYDKKTKTIHSSKGFHREKSR